VSRIIALSAVLLAGCLSVCLWGCAETGGLTLALSYDATSCGVVQARDFPLNFVGTASVHVVDRDRALEAGQDVLDAACALFTPAGNRTLEDLPALLAQGPPIADLPPGEQVAVEVRVVRGDLKTCTRHPPPDRVALFGSSSWLPLRESTPIEVRVRCPVPALAHWTFDGGAGQEPDVSGNGNDGVLVGGATRVPGIRNSALALDGLDDAMYLSTITGNLGVPFSDLTLAAWVRTDNPTAPRHVLSEIYDLSYTGYRLTINPGGALEVYVRDLDDMQPSIVHSNSSSYADGSWHHVAVVADKNGQLVFYRDGEPDGGGDILSSTGWYDEFALFSIGTDSGLPGSFFSGYIDDVQVHSRALSAGEITALASGN